MSVEHARLTAAIRAATANAARGGKLIKIYELSVGIVAAYPESGLNVGEIFAAIREGIAQGARVVSGDPRADGFGRAAGF